MRNVYLIVHGHFYQPTRENPLTRVVPFEEGAAPYHDFNEKVHAESYRPNLTCGNFNHISFDLGPTLTQWLARHKPGTLRGIVAAERAYRSRFGHSNAMAQAYNHTILPLASAREKRIQIAWGIADYRYRYGHDPAGMWLPETAVDQETLMTLADMGIQFTILAPWQAAEDVDSGEPQRVALPDGRSITAFFYNSPLSGGVSFDAQLTVNAESFVADLALPQMRRRKSNPGQPQVLLIATDGELYGHHQPYRELFLQHLLTIDAPQNGIEMTTPMRYLAEHPATGHVTLRENTSWSCHHGVTRWRGTCSCTEGDGAWKWFLRRALNRLAAQIDALYEMETSLLLRAPWALVEEYLDARLHRRSFSSLLERHAQSAIRPSLQKQLKALLETQYHRHLMFTSCAFFFDDLDRIEPVYGIANAARAIGLLRQAIGVSLEASFLDDLQSARSWRTNCTGADLYREVVEGLAWQRQEISQAQALAG